jgi:hypothetical protein
MQRLKESAEKAKIDRSASTKQQLIFQLLQQCKWSKAFKYDLTS